MSTLEDWKLPAIMEDFENKYDIHPEDLESGNYSPTDEFEDYSILVSQEVHLFITISHPSLEEIYGNEERQLLVVNKFNSYYLYDCCTELERETYRNREVGGLNPEYPPVFIYYATKLLDKYLERLDSIN